jgi:glyoxylase-like metal-dependent hydrolase (beta-lactamase superfamily II)
MPHYQIFALRFSGPTVGSGAFVMWLKEWEKTAERCGYFFHIQGTSEPVIVDTGVTPQLAKKRNLRGYSNPVQVLSRLGLESDEVRHVILTHMHWDHVGGVSLFPRATFYLQEKEYDFWLNNPIAKYPPFKLEVDEASLEYLASMEGSDRLVLLDGDKEILPGLKCLLAPGHSIALQAVAVDTDQGVAVLGSDSGHTFRNYEERWPSAVDMVALMKTHDLLKRKVSSPELLFPGHDPLLSARYAAVAQDVTRLV